MLFVYDYIIKLKPLWLSHIAAFGFYICESLVIFCTCAISIPNTQSDFIFSIKDSFILSQYIIFMLYGKTILILTCIHLFIKFFLKKSLITKNHFLLNNALYHKLWFLGTLAAIIAFIISIVWFSYVFLYELI